MPRFQAIASSKWFKPASIAAGVLVLVFLGLLALPGLIDINSYKGRIQSELETTLGRKVRLGNLKLRLFPGVRIEAADVAVGEDPRIARAEQADFIVTRSLKLKMPLLALLRGNPQVEGLELTEPQVSLIRLPGDKWNYESLKPLQESEKGTPEMAPLDLKVTGGKFTILDTTINPPASKVYSGINIELDNFSKKSQFDFRVSLDIPDGQAGRLELDGSAGPLAAGDFLQTPVDARIRAANAEIRSIEALAGLQSPRSGRLTIDSRAKGSLARGLELDGSLKAERLRLVDGVDGAPFPIEIEFNMKVASAPIANSAESDYNLDIERGRVSIGKTKFSVSGQALKLATAPWLNLQLKGDKADIANLIESSYALGAGPPKGTTASGQAGLDLKVTGNATAPELTGQLSIRNLSFKSADLPQAIQVSELKLDCKPKLITAAPFRTTLGNRTTVDIGALSLSDYSTQPRAHLEVSTDNGQIDDLLRIAESFGIKTDLTGSGTASIKASVDTRSDGKATAVNINGQGRLQQAKLTPRGFSRPLEINQAEVKFTGDSARVDNLNAQLGQSAASGWLEARNFSRPELGFDLRINQVNVNELQQIVSGYKPTGTGGTFSAAGKAWIGKVILDNLVFTDVSGNISYADQVLKLDPAALNLYNGRYQGSASIDQKQKEPAVALAGRVGGVDLNQFLTAMMGEKSVAYGRTDGAFNLRGRGFGGDAFLRSLAGNGNILITDGKITSFDLMKQVEIFGKLAGLPTGGAGTAFRRLKTNFVIGQGRLRTDALTIEMDDLNVTGNGYMDLGTVVTADYDILAKLSPALTKRFTGSSDQQQQGGLAGIGKLIGKVTAVTGNFFLDQGQLAVPLHMSGPIKSPNFSLNAEQLQKRAVEKFVPKQTDEPVKKLFELFEKKKPKP